MKLFYCHFCRVFLVIVLMKILHSCCICLHGVVFQLHYADGLGKASVLASVHFTVAVFSSSYSATAYAMVPSDVVICALKPTTLTFQVFENLQVIGNQQWRDGSVDDQPLDDQSEVSYDHNGTIYSTQVTSVNSLVTEELSPDGGVTGTER